MKPGFALSLSFEGISLLFRSATGWRRVGDVRPDAPGLDAAMAGLRRSASALAPSGVRCKIVIPNDQIRYLAVETGPADRAQRLRYARKALDGATPYALDDLVVDITTDGPVTHVAAVARETLAEAEAFAVQHRFDPVSFVAIPGRKDFPGEPFFGETAHAAGVLGPKERVEPDSDPISLAALADIPEGPVAAHLSGSDGTPGPGSGGDETPGGFASRRRRSDPAAARAGAGPGTAPGTAPIKPLPPRPARPAPTVATAQPRLHVAAAEPAAARPADPAQAPSDRPAARPAPPGLIVDPSAETAIGDEARRLTVFGARKQPTGRGRTRTVGLVLTVILLMAMAAVAAWASFFAEQPIARIFGPLDAGATDPEPAVTKLDPAILDMPAQVVAAPRPEPQAAVLADKPPPSPLPHGAADDLQALAAPGLPGARMPALASRPDAVVAMAARPEAPFSLGDGTGGAKAPPLPAIGAPAAPPPEPEPEPEPDPQPVKLAEPTAPTVPAIPAPVPATGSGTEATGPTAEYAATGIWSTAPESPDTPGLISLDDLYVAAIDHATLTQDAIALPGPATYATDVSPAGVASPAAAGTVFKLDALGLVDPSPEGTLTPDGVVVYLGNPPKVPPPTPRRIETVRDPEPLQPVLPKKRPRSRPTDLAQNVERQQFGGLTLEELRQVRPRSRPYEPAAADAIAADTQVPQLSPAEARLAGIRPAARPRNFSTIVARAKPAPSAPAATAAAAQPAPSAGTTGPAAGASTAAVASQSKSAPAVPRSQIARPSGPTPATVAKQATVKNAINLHRVNLIGVYGTPSNRRALVRLSNGRYKKVKVGDTIEGGRVVAIGDNELRYQKSGRNVVLKMPRG